MAAAAAPAAAYGISSFDTGTALQTALGAGIAGSAATGLCAIIVWSVAQVPASTQQLFGRGVTSNTGWVIRSSNTGVMQLLAANGAASATAPTRTIVAGDIGKIHITCLSHDLSAILHFHDSAQVGVSTALTGYAATAGTVETALGSASTGTAGSQPATDFTIYSWGGRNSPLSLADFQTVCTQTKSQNDGRLALGAISMDHLWHAPLSTTVPATFADAIGADSMTFAVGSEANLVSAAMSPPVWGF